MVPDIMLGVVSKIENPDKFIIRFTIEGYLEDCIAYPIENDNQPVVGDPIILFGLESVLGYSWMYKKQRLLEYTQLKHGDSVIELRKDSIIIKGGKVTIDSPDVTITGNGSGTLTTNGSVPPTGSGGYCSLINCPYTGAPHVGNKINGT